VFAGLDLVLRAGRSTALVGINGAGKTTLVKLLARLHDPDSGRILVDGIDLLRVRPAEWQRQVAVVFQDFAHYPLSFAENIGFGSPSFLSDVTGLRDAARRAGALDVLSSLSGRSGWSTVLSRSYDGGVELSGGQWQRLALARGMMRDLPLLLILDEPTASLDAITEAALFERYLSARQLASRSGAITLLVSHRFSTVRMADLIVVLDQGRVAASGDHASLIRAGGLYAELYRTQFASQEPAALA
jgi:ATP-binding cassette subfamily B protein